MAASRDDKYLFLQESDSGTNENGVLYRLWVYDLKTEQTYKLSTALPVAATFGWSKNRLLVQVSGGKPGDSNKIKIYGLLDFTEPF